MFILLGSWCRFLQVESKLKSQEIEYFIFLTLSDEINTTLTVMYEDFPVPVGPTNRADFSLAISIDINSVYLIVSTVVTIISLNMASYNIL